jgi:excisionase family DNA binding protein
VEERLDSWKEIAAYLGRKVRTVQRWANTRHLPVHRIPGGERPRVFALKAEIDAWLEASGRDPQSHDQPAGTPASGPAFDADPSQPPQASATTSPARRTRIARLAVSLAVLVAGAVALGRWLRPDAPRAHYSRTAIAVLPLENLSPQDSSAYFVGGLHEELLTQLAKVSGLTVVGRTSVMAYAGTKKPLREIGKELGVGSIVEGSVQVVGSQLRVNVQLIDPMTQVHLWAEHYDRTLGDAFAVQSDIARRVVAAVGARLTSAEDSAFSVAPTQSAEAYQLYLQGREYYRRPGYELANLQIAQRLFERAVALDSTFALAHAALSEVHGLMSWLRYDASPERLARQRVEAESALRLAPELPASHAAVGLALYYGKGDYRGALDQFGLALRAAPGDAEVWALTGSAYRRLGNWDSVEVAFEKASRLDPRNANLFYDLRGLTCQSQRRYADAIAAFRRALALAPDHPAAHLAIGWTYAAWTGQLDTLRAIWTDTDAATRVATGGLDLLLLERKPDSVLAALEGAHLVWREDQPVYYPTVLYAGWAHELRGDTAAARAAFQTGLGLLDSLQRVLPDDWRVHAARGRALAGLRRRSDAEQEAAWLARSRLYRDDRFLGPVLEEERAAILARAGVPGAIEALERLLAEPSQVSVPLLRMDPRWDPIRNDPRFQALLRLHADAGTP